MFSAVCASQPPSSTHGHKFVHVSGGQKTAHPTEPEPLQGGHSFIVPTETGCRSPPEYYESVILVLPGTAHQYHNPLIR